ncbi:class II peroxidase [Plenodomus tracheiphilus IPT5]|uniref:Peroxidase n=1 Tax=Plenodomus tracheiphilus IPT5 TaxID=1408161 RepID=A0A6A7B4D0_9PLEO|nr:class II peroxidase [Plenodomus tracheiphilus IPT5]
MMQMHVLTILLHATYASALNIWPRQTGDCPSVWAEIAEQLKSDFAGCNPLSHAAIRAPFHDCINNGCDGSLILTDECSRSENAGLQDVCSYLLSLTNQFSVSAADTVQFAAAVAISSCPIGPRVRALVGRPSSNGPAQEGQIPSSRDPVEEIIGAFQAKGISADELVALLGTHSVAQQRFDDPSRSGKPLDSTPGKYDTLFYEETRSGTAPYTLSSDRRLSNYSETADAWSNFADSASGWDAIFVPAWNKFSVIGNNVGTLHDCSYLIPQSQVSRKRAYVNTRFREKMAARFNN